MTNQSLKDEIYMILDSHFYMDGLDRQTTRSTTIPEILSLIEKRIDEIPARHDSDTVEEVNYTNGWNHAISEVRMKLT